MDEIDDIDDDDEYEIPHLTSEQFSGLMRANDCYISRRVNVGTFDDALVWVVRQVDELKPKHTNVDISPCFANVEGEQQLFYQAQIHCRI